MEDILFLAHRVPFPPDRGDKIRTYHVLRHLAVRARVHLVAFADDFRDLAHGDALAGLTASCRIIPRTKPNWRAGVEALASGQAASVIAFADPAMRRAVDVVRAAHTIAATYVFSSQMAQYVPAATPRFVMDFCDVDSAKFAQYGAAARGPRGWLLRREARLLLAHDVAVAARASASVFVSPAEATLFRERAGRGNVQVVANGIDTESFDPAAAFARMPAEPALIVFTGQMDYPPNVAAVAWFARDILPLVQAAQPSARFAIVGRNPTAAVRALGDRPGVVVTGEVADVRGWLAAAAVVVAPLAIARGVQNKVLEAMAMARPVVASMAAAEGIDHGGTLRIGADTAGIAAAVTALLDDPAAAAALGASARARVIARYGWEAALAPLDALLGLSAAASSGQRVAA